MKKALLIAIFGFLASMVNGQVKTMYSDSQSLDTVTNTASATWYTTTGGQNSSFSLQINITKISGTVGGTLRVMYSNDGSNWFSFASDSTITPTDASGSYGWQLNNVSAPYIGVKWTGTGTMSGSASATLNPRRRM
jgi:hypothetical protein